MTSVVFPGQGSQFVGMAKDFYNQFKIAKSIFEEIEDYTKISIRKVIFDNEDALLDLTQYTQVCIFASSYAIFEVYINEKNINIKDFNVMMGHSLGEYTALACSKKISLMDCCQILKLRGELMNNAVEPNKTGMAALIGRNADSVQRIIDDNKLSFEIANDNSPMQVVISGLKNEIETNKELFLNNGVKKFVTLNVSAAFHSKFMNDAQEKLKEKIEKLNFLENEINIITNYDAELHKDSLTIKEKLQKQMANKVNWTLSIKKLEEIGEKNILEIGPNKVLSGLINRISKNFGIKSINTVSDLLI